MSNEQIISITDLRDDLGIACQQVANTGKPIIIRRYKREDVALVPLWEWRFFKRIEAAIRDGRLPWRDALAELADEESD